MAALKIDIGVGGRFHSDYMAKALIDSGHDVRLFTTLPRSRFPALPAQVIRPILWPEMVYRLAKSCCLENAGDMFKMVSFGKRMAREIRQADRHSDVFVGWSSFSHEALLLRRAKHSVVVRDSAHILFQTEILQREYETLGLKFPKRKVCTDRELAEYANADRIMVLSEFAKRTFTSNGIPADKVKVIPLGVNVSLFKPPESMNVKLPLRVVYFGTLTIRKGVQYLLEATRNFSPRVMTVHLVGSLDPHFKRILRKYHHAMVHPHMSHASLSSFLRDMHVFVFPTLEDGFGQVLVQAMASGLAPISTDHCGASELIRNGQNGFIVPAGKTESIMERLNHLMDDLKLVSHLRHEASRISATTTWDEYADRFTRWITEATASPGRATL